MAFRRFNGALNTIELARFVLFCGHASRSAHGKVAPLPLQVCARGIHSYRALNKDDHNVIQCFKESENANQTVDIAKLTERIIDKASERDILVKTLSRQKVQGDIKSLIDFGALPRDVEKLCQLTSLSKLHSVIQLIHEMFKFGFQLSKVLSIFLRSPSTISISADQFANQIESFQNIGLDSSAVVQMAVKDPRILEKDANDINSRVEEMKLLFKTSDTLSMIEGVPDLLFCDSHYIKDRFNYVFHVMGVSQRQITYSKLFSHSMDHIHARHMFLVRTGFFKKLVKKSGHIDNNPSLDTIIDTTDEKFVKKFGGMTVADYLTFKQLLLRENIILGEIEDD